MTSPIKAILLDNSKPTALIPMLANLLKLLLRHYPIERGKFKILNDVYYRFVPPAARPNARQTLKYGIRMNIDASEFLQSHLFLYGSYELPTVKFIRSFLKNGMTAVDVGAQIGYLTLVMATIDKSIAVHAVEPEPVNINKLKSNIALNCLRNVTVHEVGLSDKDGGIRLYLSNDHNAGTHSTVQNVANVSDNFVDINCYTLDSMMSDGRIKDCHLIKIDVEGGELEVIKGALNTLSNSKPVIIMELSDALQNARGFSTMEFKRLMQDHGYSSFTISDSGKLILSSTEIGHAMENVVFVHQNKLQTVEILS
ncbi:MAG: FkbM family methyltransferase [Ignavibacteria bacterium]|nr:FkbM family methyltransferase [Ignavibacteria bacterium]